MREIASAEGYVMFRRDRRRPGLCTLKDWNAMSRFPLGADGRNTADLRVVR
jgi:hypothetical protein